MRELKQYFESGQDLKRGKLYLVKMENGDWIEASFCKKVEVIGWDSSIYYYRFLTDIGKISIEGDKLINEVKFIKS